MCLRKTCREKFTETLDVRFRGEGGEGFWLVQLGGAVYYDGRSRRHKDGGRWCLQLWACEVSLLWAVQWYTERSRQLGVALGSFSSTGLELTLDLLHPVTVTAGKQAGPPPVGATCPLSAVAPYRAISHCGFCFSIHSHGFTLKVSLSTVCSLLICFRVWNRMQTS